MNVWRYSWKVTTLTYMYDQLGDVYFVQTKQFGGYDMLIQVNHIHN